MIERKGEILVPALGEVVHQHLSPPAPVSLSLVSFSRPLVAGGSCFRVQGRDVWIYEAVVSSLKCEHFVQTVMNVAVHQPCRSVNKSPPCVEKDGRSAP